MIIEGEIRPGLFVHIPFDLNVGIRLLIDGIEMAPDGNVDDVRLCMCAGPNLTEMLRGLSLRGGTFEVSEAP